MFGRFYRIAYKDSIFFIVINGKSHIFAFVNKKSADKISESNSRYIYIKSKQNKERHVRMEKSMKEYKDAMNGFERCIKRIIDFTGALCLIIVLSPILLLIFIFILITGGNAIYRQERIGYGGNPFTIYKFRIMSKDAEQHGILRTADERISHMTKLGRFLCEHHLDELPQLFNVLIGDMSFVGPRPERRVFVEQILKENPDYVHIYKMRPGLTSNAALYNGYTHTMEKMLIRLDMDLAYLTTRSLWGDFIIVCKTALMLLSGKKF